MMQSLRNEEEKKKLNCLYKWFTTPSTGEKTPQVLFSCNSNYFRIVVWRRHALSPQKAAQGFANIPCVKEEKS